MNFTEEPAADRRAVPRHLRDSEHTMSGQAPGAGTRVADAPAARRRGWIYTLLVLVAAAVIVWLAVRAYG